MDFCNEYKFLNDENHVFIEISYNDLRDMIDEFKSGLVIIGGPWCNHTQAIMRETNQIAKREKLDTVYVYNPRFINIFKVEEDLRDCESLEHKLDYYYLIEKIGYKNKNNELVRDTLIQRMDTPTFIAIKNGSVIDYFTSEYIKDPYIRLENTLADKTMEFNNRISNMIKKLKEIKVITD